MLALLTALMLVQSTAPSPFNGVWTMDIPSAIESGETQHIALERGRFGRGGTSGFDVVADGRFHPVKSDDYVDYVAVSVIDARTVRERDRLKGKLVYTVDYHVSADGATLTRTVVGHTGPDGRAVPTTLTERRVGTRTRSGSLLTGAWKTIAIQTTDAHLRETLTLDNGRFGSRQDNGYGYDAVIGGAPVPIAGDSDTVRAAVAMPDDRTVVVTLTRTGTPMMVQRLTIRPDGRSIDVAARRLRDGFERTWVLHRE